GERLDIGQARGGLAGEDLHLGDRARTGPGRHVRGAVAVEVGDRGPHPAGGPGERVERRGDRSVRVVLGDGRRATGARPDRELRDPDQDRRGGRRRGRGRVGGDVAAGRLAPVTDRRYPNRAAGDRRYPDQAAGDRRVEVADERLIEAVAEGEEPVVAERRLVE